MSASPLAATRQRHSPGFHGTAVVRAAFVLAVFGWGIGFYGPPVFMHAVAERTGWPVSLVASAVTFHFLLGAVVVSRLPRIHARIGLPAATAGGALVLAIGVLGWALAARPWQLFAAAALTGGGWVMLGAAAINAIVSPWFVRGRPMALAKAYNGASIGGVIFSPLWVALIGRLGFTAAALLVGLAMLLSVAVIAARVLARTPEGAGQEVDGGLPVPAASLPAGSAPAGAAAPALPALAAHPRLLGRALWTDRAFLTLVAAMALGLFAQIGLIAHLYSLLVPVWGAQAAGWAMALATACGIAGRTVVARILGADTDRRIVAGANYAMQAIGTLLMLAAGEQQTALLLAGIVFFGLGIGNATSLPPLIAQAEFAKEDVPRVVALAVAIGQGFYAFAPAAFALLLAAQGHAAVAPRLGTHTTTYFIAALLIQAMAAACMLGGRGRHRA